MCVGCAYVFGYVCVCVCCVCVVSVREKTNAHGLLTYLLVINGVDLLFHTQLEDGLHGLVGIVQCARVEY